MHNAERPTDRAGYRASYTKAMEQQIHVAPGQRQADMLIDHLLNGAGASGMLTLLGKRRSPADLSQESRR